MGFDQNITNKPHDPPGRGSCPGLSFPIASGAYVVSSLCVLAESCRQPLITNNLLAKAFWIGGPTAGARRRVSIRKPHLLPPLSNLNDLHPDFALQPCFLHGQRRQLPL